MSTSLQAAKLKLGIIHDYPGDDGDVDHDYDRGDDDYDHCNHEYDGDHDNDKLKLSIIRA